MYVDVVSILLYLVVFPLHVPSLPPSPHSLSLLIDVEAMILLVLNW